MNCCYRVDSGTEQVVSSSYTVLSLPEGMHELRFYGVDRVGNAGPISIVATVPDAPPIFSNPEIAAAGSGVYVPITELVNSSTVDARMYTQDTDSGLSTTTAPGPPDLTAGTKALLHFDEGSGLDAYDISGNTANFTLQGGTSWSQGRFGSAVQLDGFSGYLNLGLNTPLNNPSFTISVWVKPLAVTGSRAILSYGGVYLELWNGQPAITLSAQNPSESLTAGGGPPLSLGEWHHIAATFDGTTLKMYADGALVRGNLPARVTYQEGGSARLGKAAWDGGTNYFHGLLNEFRHLNYGQDWENILRQYRKG